jgi:hypothetical protein
MTYASDVDTQPHEALPGPESDDRPRPARWRWGPRRLRDEVGAAFWRGLEFLGAASAMQASAVVLSGLEKHSGAPLRALYFGSGHHRAYLLALTYREYRVEARHDGLRAWHARRWIDRLGDGVDLIFADLPWPYDRLLAGQTFVAMPAWINQRMPLPARWQDVYAQLRPSARREDMRLLRKHRFEASLTRDRQAVRRFYEEMYAPRLARRFGEAAYVEPRGKIDYCVNTGTLMEIRRAGRLVAAQVLWEDRGSLQFLWAGTVDGASTPPSRGVYPALFYYGILHAFERGCTEVDYGGSRPLLSDGTFQLKRRWGGTVFDGWSRETLLVRPNRLDPASRSFFANNPLVTRTRDGLVGRLLNPGSQVAPEQIARAAQIYGTPGLRALRLYLMQTPPPETREAARALPGIELVDLSVEPDPAIAFCR